MEPRIGVHESQGRAVGGATEGREIVKLRTGAQMRRMQGQRPQVTAQTAFAIMQRGVACESTHGRGAQGLALLGAQRRLPVRRHQRMPAAWSSTLATDSSSVPKQR